MTEDEVAEIFALLAAFDERTMSRTAIRAWHMAIFPEITKYQGMRAVTAWYQQNSPREKRLDVATFNQLAKTMPKIEPMPLHPRALRMYPDGQMECRECRLVHFPHEDCSVLISMQQYGVARFRAEVKQAREEARAQRRRRDRRAVRHAGGRHAAAVRRRVLR
jgi:hypothetical protein